MSRTHPDCTCARGGNADTCECREVSAARTPTLLERLASRIIRNVCELPDYTSPDNQPDLLMCEVRELDACIERALDSLPEIANACNSHGALVAALERALKWRSCAGAYANGDHKTLAEMRADFEAGEAALKAAKEST